jgi:hypothetical protein
MVFFCLRRVVKGKSLVPVFLMAVVLVALSGCSSSSSNASDSKTPAPSNLVYPAATISAVPGQAIAPDVPTVTGTVTSYSVSPALPAGLTLNTSTGTISGTISSNPTQPSAPNSYTITASNAAGSTTTTVQIAVLFLASTPGGPIYPETNLSATVGQPITPDTPTVTGTVSSYAITPNLPAGLSLNTSTGTISGTPTLSSAQTTYTVTASNAYGSATTFISIAVNPAAPSALAYPQTTIVAMVNQPVPPDIPAVQGTVTSFTVSPSLPAGLSLDSSTGTISGTPSQITGQVSYTVTGSNAGGSTTSAVSITVNKQYQTLLDLGHGWDITDMQSISGRLLSHDRGGHWVLWDTSTDTKIVDGDQVGLTDPYVPGFMPTFWPVALAGSTVAIGQANGVEVRSSADGHRIAIIASPNFIDSSNASTKTWWKLSSDGTYLCAGSPSGLNVWSAGGQLLFSRPGDYSSAVAFAAANQIQIATGPAGANVIETISVPGGTSSVGPSFSGTFNSWFLDGQRFLTNTGNTVWTYSSASVQQAIVSFPSISGLVGQGNWITTTSVPYQSPSFQIFAIGANSPSATYNSYYTILRSGQTLRIINTDGTGNFLDLSGTTLSPTNFTVPIASLSHLSAYAANPASQWFIGDSFGVVVDGPSLSSTPKYFDSGQAWNISGSTNRVAVALAKGEIDYFGAGTLALDGTVSLSSSNVQLSSDGSVLAANDLKSNQTLNIYSLPGGTLNTSIPYPTNGMGLYDFSLSGSGTVLGQTLSNGPYASLLQVGPVAAAPTWSTPGDSTNFVKVSPDGTSWAVSDGTAGSHEKTTNIYNNGILTTAFQAWFVGWIDNDRFLVNVYDPNPRVIIYLNALICDKTGATLSTLSLPELHQIQSLGSGLIYSPEQNAIYSLSTGQPVWNAPIPTYTNGPGPNVGRNIGAVNKGAVVGSNVAFAYGSKVLVDTR